MEGRRKQKTKTAAGSPPQTRDPPFIYVKPLGTGKDKGKGEGGEREDTGRREGTAVPALPKWKGKGKDRGQGGTGKEVSLRPLRFLLQVSQGVRQGKGKRQRAGTGEDRNQPRELVSTVGSLLSSPVLSLLYTN